MKIGSSGLPEAKAAVQVVETPPVDAAKPASPATPAAAELQSAVLQPALAALRNLPDIDEAKVAALRDALARGEMPFNAAKLAGLIERYHGNRE
ncbi:MAG: negative regulator of flagellin synthesis LfgM [Rhodocyclaceae bacterium]|nr:negative regulator of flagellin synthesis LfgM [Rhodocyclaceae bacterium]